MDSRCMLQKPKNAVIQCHKIIINCFNYYCVRCPIIMCAETLLGVGGCEGGCEGEGGGGERSGAGRGYSEGRGGGDGCAGVGAAGV